MPKSKKKIVAVLEDLMFTVKINEAARKAGLPVEFVKSEEDVLDRAAANPTAIIFDLNCHSVNPLQVIGRLRENGDFKGVSLIGYLSHVQGELKRQAHEAGTTLKREFLVLFMHGLLHLLGFTHDSEKGSRKMIEISENILAGVIEHS